MINIIGAKYLKIDISEIKLTDESDHRKMILFNIMSDASDVIDIDLYKKTPMASIIFTYPKDGLEFEIEMEFFKSKGIEDLAMTIGARSAARRETVLNSNSSEYKYIAESVKDKKLHSMVLMFDMSCRDNYVKEVKNYAIAAIPCRGIITPLKKSKGFDLYNGELVMTKNFISGFGYDCNRIIYVFAKVNSYIPIEEYYHDCGEYIGLCTIHTIGGLYHSAVDALAGYEDFIDSNNSRNDLSIRALNYTTEHYIIPYDGNETLFKKTGGNIFSLSSSNQSRVTRVKITS